MQLKSAAETYAAMLIQITLDYPGLPDPRTMTVSQIRWFYDGMRAQLKKHHSRVKPTKGPRHG